MLATIAVVVSLHSVPQIALAHAESTTVAASPTQIAQSSRPNRGGGEFTISLADGTQLKGRLADTRATVESNLGQLTIETAKIERYENRILVLTDGSKVQATFTGNLIIQSSLGPLTISGDKVTALGSSSPTVARPRPSSAPAVIPIDYGFYVVDGGKLIELSANGASSLLDLSGSAQFIVFHRQVTQIINNVSLVSMKYVKEFQDHTDGNGRYTVKASDYWDVVSLGPAASSVVNLRQRPEPGQTEMVRLVPANALKPGAYALIPGKLVPEMASPMNPEVQPIAKFVVDRQSDAASPESNCVIKIRGVPGRGSLDQLMAMTRPASAEPCPSGTRSSVTSAQGQVASRGSTSSPAGARSPNSQSAPPAGSKMGIASPYAAAERKEIERVTSLGAKADQIRSLLRQAHADSEAQRLRDAARNYEAALSLDPLNHSALIGLAAHHVTAGQIDRAEALIRQASEAIPTSPYVKAVQAYLVAQRGDINAAMTKLREVRDMGEGLVLLTLKHDRNGPKALHGNARFREMVNVGLDDVAQGRFDPGFLAKPSFQTVLNFPPESVAAGLKQYVESTGRRLIVSSDYLGFYATERKPDGLFDTTFYQYLFLLERVDDSSTKLSMKGLGFSADKSASIGQIFSDLQSTLRPDFSKETKSPHEFLLELTSAIRGDTPPPTRQAAPPPNNQGGPAK